MKKSENHAARNLSIDLISSKIPSRNPSFKMPTMDMLFVAPWTASSVIEVNRWRLAVNPLLRMGPKIIGQPGYTERPYPEETNKQVLVDSFLRRDLLDRKIQDDEELVRRGWTKRRAPLNNRKTRDKAQPGSDDRDCLGWWFGLALAFDHNDNLARMAPKATGQGRQTLFEIFDLLMEECAAVAWHGQDLPDWAEDIFGPVLEGIHPDEIDLFRPWADVQENLITVLSAFYQYTKRSHQSMEFTDEAVLGCMAIKLLAAVCPGRVDDQLVCLVEWVSQNIQGDSYDEETTEETKKLIHVAWERSLLERGKKDLDAKDEDGTGQVMKQEIPSLRKTRRRTI